LYFRAQKEDSGDEDRQDWQEVAKTEQQKQIDERAFDGCAEAQENHAGHG
jgi:hypothetical protein